MTPFGNRTVISRLRVLCDTVGGFLAGLFKVGMVWRGSDRSGVNRSGSNRSAGSPLRLGVKGQSAVEMAIVMPVTLALVGISINLMIYFGDCARFDRVAAEAVRTEAASPGYGEYGSLSRAGLVQTRIESSFTGSDHLSFSVSVTEGGIGYGLGSSKEVGESDIGFSLLPHNETFTCTMQYRPWGMGNSFFGIEFTGVPHTRTYVIDPYRPGVIF